MDKIIVTTWCNAGAKDRNNASLGIRIPKFARNKYFHIKYKQVILELKGESKETTVNIDKASFWGACSELIHTEIRDWLIKNKYNNWKRGKPHKLELYYKGENLFLLTGKI